MTKVQHQENLLWQRLKRGNDANFSQFYDAYIDFLFSVGLAYSNDKDLIKDSIHDLFVDIYKYRKKLSANVNVKAYLVKSLKRKIAANQKKASRLRLEDSINDANYPNLIHDNFIKNDDSGMQRKLLREMEKLPGRQKEALILKYQNELSYPEVAAIMNISVESARTLVYRTLKTLRKNLNSVQALVVMLFCFIIFYLK